ncbi:unnamed protein product, partial [Heterotrigona itama]
RNKPSRVSAYEIKRSTPLHTLDRAFSRKKTRARAFVSSTRGAGADEGGNTWAIEHAYNGYIAGRGDVASLVRNLLGPIYGDGVINLLIRQARDILVCAYHGNLENFLKTYLSPAACLLAEVKSAASE